MGFRRTSTVDVRDDISTFEGEFFHKSEYADSILSRYSVHTFKVSIQQGADFSGSAAKAEAARITTITGKCILMYAEPVGGIHAIHRFFAKLFGKL